MKDGSITMGSQGGLAVALCQMKVVPARPDLNVAYIVGEIRSAARRGVDIIVFPELATTGYLLGDLFEDRAFLEDVEYLNRAICEATKDGIAAVVGTPVSVPQNRGEDGRPRLLNAAVIYANGRRVGHVAKTLQPNYRIFDDDRHFYSTRKIASERKISPEELLVPVPLALKDGRTIRLGVILCEDMWHEDYPVNPALVLAQKGADIICNISASPWTWQKNRKRHQIVGDLVRTCRVPFVYVNNTGMQNTGKNLVAFDGSSTVYNEQGSIVFEVPPYSEGTHDITLRAGMPTVAEVTPNDTRELYEAIRCSVREFFAGFEPERRKVIIGLSGGIDSSLAAALFTDALGPENVIGINMPSDVSSQETRERARTLAANLGIAYEVRPMQSVADAILSECDVEKDSPTYENIQARARMEILAARAQMLNCMFSANWNKVEAAFGYGTLYGDMAGAIAPIGDLVKREVYQLAAYLNNSVFQGRVIPQECFDATPTAELRSHQRDPFDYGTLERRGYHDEMVRAFTEFRRNPQWFLELYLAGTLEREFMLNEGHLQGLFSNAQEFIADLEKHWKMFHKSYFKRVQGPPIPIVSKRAFGTDLRESLGSVYPTARYRELKKEILETV